MSTTTTTTTSNNDDSFDDNDDNDDDNNNNDNYNDKPWESCHGQDWLPETTEEVQQLKRSKKLTGHRILQFYFNLLKLNRRQIFKFEMAFPNKSSGQRNTKKAAKTKSKSYKEAGNRFIDISHQILKILLAKHSFFLLELSLANAWAQERWQNNKRKERKKRFFSENLFPTAFAEF